MTLFARMAKPIDFESQDGEPVDLLFLLLAPDHAGGDHLEGPGPHLASRAGTRCHRAPEVRVRRDGSEAHPDASGHLTRGVN